MSKKLIVLGVAAAVVGGYLLTGDGGDGDRATEQASEQWANQVWIDKVPLRETDKMNVFAALIDPQFGVFQSTSQWEGDYTIFSWVAKGKNKAEIEMMQTQKKHKLKMSVSTKDCGQFDLCMTIKGAPRGPATYYSMRDWVIEGGDGLRAGALAAKARALAKQLK